MEEETKLNLIEQESTIKMEKLRAEAARERLNIEKERLKFKVYLLHERVQLLKEGYHEIKLIVHSL